MKIKKTHFILLFILLIVYSGCSQSAIRSENAVKKIFGQEFSNIHMVVHGDTIDFQTSDLREAIKKIKDENISPKRKEIKQNEMNELDDPNFIPQPPPPLEEPGPKQIDPKPKYYEFPVEVLVTIDSRQCKLTVDLKEEKVMGFSYSVIDRGFEDFFRVVFDVKTQEPVEYVAVRYKLKRDWEHISYSIVADNSINYKRADAIEKPNYANSIELANKIRRFGLGIISILNSRQCTDEIRLENIESPQLTDQLNKKLEELNEPLLMLENEFYIGFEIGSLMDGTPYIHCFFSPVHLDKNIKIYHQTVSIEMNKILKQELKHIGKPILFCLPLKVMKTFYIKIVNGNIEEFIE